MNWIYKAILQKTVSYLPQSHTINYLLQRYISVGENLPEAFVIDRLKHAQKHILSFQKWGQFTLSQTEILEIGTGWYPIVPIALFLSGAKSIESVDIRKLYTQASINQTLRSFINLHNANKLDTVIPNLVKNKIPALYAALNETNVEQKLRILSIKCTTCTIDKLTIHSLSKDFIISNNTIQLIDKAKMSGFMAELFRVSKDKSVLSLSIDLTDEFSHFDTSISNYNFLRYSEWQWNLISNRLSNQNRLRNSDYQNSINKFSFEIVDNETITGHESEISKIKLHKSFKHYDLNDILVKQTHFVVIVHK